MKIIYSILQIYGLAFIIGMFVAFIIWVMNRAISGDIFHHIVHREGYNEMKRIRHRKNTKE
jgi:hypothetical protein